MNATKCPVCKTGKMKKGTCRNQKCASNVTTVAPNASPEAPDAATPKVEAADAEGRTELGIDADELAEQLERGSEVESVETARSAGGREAGPPQTVAGLGPKTEPTEDAQPADAPTAEAKPKAGPPRVFLTPPAWPNTTTGTKGKKSGATATRAVEEPPKEAKPARDPNEDLDALKDQLSQALELAETERIRADEALKAQTEAVEARTKAESEALAAEKARFAAAQRAAKAEREIGELAAKVPRESAVGQVAKIGATIGDRVEAKGAERPKVPHTARMSETEKSASASAATATAPKPGAAKASTTPTTMEANMDAGKKPNATIEFTNIMKPLGVLSRVEGEPGKVTFNSEYDANDKDREFTITFGENEQATSTTGRIVTANIGLVREKKRGKVEDVPYTVYQVKLDDPSQCKKQGEEWPDGFMQFACKEHQGHRFEVEVFELASDGTAKLSKRMGSMVIGRAMELTIPGEDRMEAYVISDATSMYDDKGRFHQVVTFDRDEPSVREALNTKSNGRRDAAKERPMSIETTGGAVPPKPKKNPPFAGGECGDDCSEPQKVGWTDCVSCGQGWTSPVQDKPAVAPAAATTSLPGWVAETPRPEAVPGNQRYAGLPAIDTPKDGGDCTYCKAIARAGDETCRGCGAKFKSRVLPPAPIAPPAPEAPRVAATFVDSTPVVVPQNRRNALLRAVDAPKAGEVCGRCLSETAKVGDEKCDGCGNRFKTPVVEAEARVTQPEDVPAAATTPAPAANDTVVEPTTTLGWARRHPVLAPVVLLAGVLLGLVVTGYFVKPLWDDAKGTAEVTATEQPSVAGTTTSKPAPSGSTAKSDAKTAPKVVKALAPRVTPYTMNAERFAWVMSVNLDFSGTADCVVGDMNAPRRVDFLCDPAETCPTKAGPNGNKTCYDMRNAKIVVGPEKLDEGQHFLTPWTLKLVREAPGNADIQGTLPWCVTGDLSKERTVDLFCPTLPVVKDGCQDAYHAGCTVKVSAPSDDEPPTKPMGAPGPITGRTRL